MPINHFMPGTPLYLQSQAKIELNRRIMEGEIHMDWRGGCDNIHRHQQGEPIPITFQINMGDQLSEDSYCLACLYEEILLLNSLK